MARLAKGAWHGVSLTLLAAVEIAPMFQSNMASDDFLFWKETRAYSIGGSRQYAGCKEKETSFIHYFIKC